METLVVRLKTAGARHLNYQNRINSEDFKQVALLLLDLESNGVNIQKAIKEYQRLKDEDFPW